GDEKSSFGGTKKGESFHGAFSRYRSQPDSPAFVGEGLGHGLDQLLIVTSWRSHRNAQGYRPQHIIQAGRGGTKKKNADGEHQQQGSPSWPAPAGDVAALAEIVGCGHCCC